MILDAMPAYILYKDDKNTILRVNKHVADSLGVRKEDLEGAATETFYPELASKYLQDDLEVINSGIAKLNIEEEYAAIGKERFWIRTDKIPLKNKEAQDVNSILVMATDITKEKRSRDLILQKTTELERSNKALEEFAYFVSHDLQEPIRTVSNYVELLINHVSKDKEPDEKLQKYSEFILYSSKKMRAMIKDILTYAKLGSFGQIEDVNLNEIIEEVKVTHSSKIEETNTQIICDKLPTLKARRFEMLQLFQNLITNSIKFIPRDRNPIIEIECEAVDDYHRFSVKDNGIGLEEKDYEKIFIVFQRVFNQEHDGTGVGLSICKKVVNNYNGEISIDSQVGEWTKFTFTLKSLVV